MEQCGLMSGDNTLRVQLNVCSWFEVQNCHCETDLLVRLLDTVRDRIGPCIGKFPIQLAERVEFYDAYWASWTAVVRWIS